MDLKKEILKDNKSLYAFSKKHNISPQKVNYWVKADWEYLTKTTKDKINLLLKTDD